MQFNALRRLKVLALKPAEEAPVDPMVMFRELDKGLTTLAGPFKQQPFVPQAGKFKTVVRAGKPGKGKQIYRFLENLGFTGVYKSVTGYFGGVRHEVSGEQTIVNYDNNSGIISIVTQLKLPS